MAGLLAWATLVIVPAVVGAGGNLDWSPSAEAWRPAWLNSTGPTAQAEILLLGAILVLAAPATALASHGTALRHGRLAGRDWPLPRLALAYLPAGLLVAVSLSAPAGPIAALAAAPWTAVTLAAAACGGSALVTRRRASLAERLGLLSLIYLGVGGAWLFAAQAGIVVAGFPRIVALLTAAHFHVAGFTTLASLAWLARRLPGATHQGSPNARPGAVAAKTGAVALAIGMPAVAAGITFSQRLETFAAFTLALVLAGAIATLAGWAAVSRLASLRRLIRALMILAAAFLLPGMALAAYYALFPTLDAGEPIINPRLMVTSPLDVGRMVRLHGAGNLGAAASLLAAAWLLRAELPVDAENRVSD